MELMGSIVIFIFLLIAFPLMSMGFDIMELKEIKLYYRIWSITYVLGMIAYVIATVVHFLL